MSRRKRGFFQSSNPYLTEERFAEESAQLTMDQLQDNNYMTVSGAINKTFLLGAMMLCTAAISFLSANPILTIGGAIAGLILVIVAFRNKERASLWAPLYALAEGFFVGGITAMFATAYDGIIFQAVSITIGLLFAMIFVYKSGLIKVTKSFRTGIMMATFGIFIVYMINFVLSFFGMNLPFLHQGDMLGIGISVFILGIATLNLLLDFDTIEKGAAYKAPMYMEWLSGMGLLITLVWIYVEVLRLLAILSGRE